MCVSFYKKSAIEFVKQKDRNEEWVNDIQKKNSEDECEERNRVACREHPPAGWTTTTDQRELQTTIDVALAETGS